MILLSVNEISSKRLASRSLVDLSFVKLGVSMSAMNRSARLIS